MEHRLRKLHLVHPEIGDRRPQCRVADAHPDHQPQREQRVDNPLPELRGLRKLLIQMQRLRVQRQRAEQHVVHLGDCAPQRMFEGLPFMKVLEIKPGHETSHI